MEILFWSSSALLLYIYIGYPALLRCLPKKAAPGFAPLSEDQLPSVSILIAAFNEEACIEATIRNKLTQDYPANLLDVIVISDESSDATDSIVEKISISDTRVRLLRQVPRQGKTAAINRAALQATGDILIFSDANSHYDSHAVRELVACFQDPTVGYATGKMVYINQDGSLVGDGCSAYMKYENAIRALETKISSVVGVDGGIDAIRKSLYQPMNPDQLPDFVQPLKVVSQGKRVVYCEKALLNEHALNQSGNEFRMRVRVSLRAYWAMSDMRHLFNPASYGLFSLQIISHKLLRYLAFIPLFTAFISNALLTGHSDLYLLTFIIQLLFYGAAIVASISDNNNRWLTLAHYFCLINLAAAKAFFKFLRREKIVIWKPRIG